jgi:site-specific DNA recombinase
MSRPPQATKYFVYARKSTDDIARQARSIGDQLAELRELAQRDDLVIIDTLVEKRTAKTPGRPVFNAMLDRIAAGEADGILAWHPDRLTRNSLDGGRLVHLIDTGSIRDLRFPTYQFEPTAHGKLMLAFSFGMSKYYVDNLSENIRRGHRQKVKNGIWPQLPPIGYLNDRTSRTIVIDQTRAPFVRKAFEMYATGYYTIDELTKRVNEMGLTSRRGTPLSRAQYHRLLSNPFYCGLFRFTGEIHNGKHEALIPLSLFEQTEHVREECSNPKDARLKPYVYRGCFRCGECGCLVTSETQKGHTYLHCTKRVKRDCREPFVREEKIAEQIRDVLASVEMNDDDADWLTLQLQMRQRTEDATYAAAVHEVEERIRRVDAKIDRLSEAFADDAMTLDEYRRAKNVQVKEREALKETLGGMKTNAMKRFEPAIRFVSACKQAVFLARGREIEKQRDMFKKIGSNPLLTDRRLRFTPRGAWELVVAQDPFGQPAAARSALRAAACREKSHILHKRRR